MAYDALPSSLATLETIACAPGEGEPSGKMYSAVRSDAVSVSVAQGVTSRSSQVPESLSISILCGHDTIRSHSISQMKATCSK